MKKNLSFGTILSRKDKRKIIGGSDCDIELCCTTPNGTECWRRSSISGSAGSVCQGIYPAYGSAVSGVWTKVCVGIVEEPESGQMS
jgi:hypothetical protein